MNALTLIGVRQADSFTDITSIATVVTMTIGLDLEYADAAV